MKNILSFFLVAIICLAALTGCREIVHAATPSPPGKSIKIQKHTAFEVLETQTAENFAYENQLNKLPDIAAGKTKAVYKRIKNKIYSNREIRLEPEFIKRE